MRKISVKTGVTAAFALALVGFPVSQPYAQGMAGGAPKLVDCTLPEPQSIQDVLAVGAHQTITVRGLCTEDVVIVSDDITLQGETPLDGISGGGITVDGARRVVIDNLTVSGSPDHGVVAKSGASVTVSNSTITGNSRFGILVSLGATAQINGNDFSGNGEEAVIVVEEGSARLRSNTITTAYIPGAIGVFRNASLRFNGGNTVTNTNGAGNATAVVAFHVSNIRQDFVDDRGPDVLTANRAISVGNLSTVDLRDFTVTGDARVGDQGNLRLRNGTFNGNISTNAVTSVFLSTGFIVNGNATVGVLSEFAMTNGTFNGDIFALGVNSVAIKLSGVTFTGTCFPFATVPSSPGVCLNF